MVGEATKERGEKEFRLTIFDELECITYDARVRIAAAMPGTGTKADQLATMFIDDVAIDRVNEGNLSAFMAPSWDDNQYEGLNFSFPWPRFMYGQLVREMKAQGARAVGFDVLFPELELSCAETAVTMDETNILSSDAFFAEQIKNAGNVVLATEGTLIPQQLFARNAAGIGNIQSRSDYGVLRRVRAFGEYKVWHPLITNMIHSMNIKLSEARHTNISGKEYIWIRRVAKGAEALEAEPDPVLIPLHPNGDMVMDKQGEINISEDTEQTDPNNKQRPYRLERAWNLGIHVAAMHLGLDLDKAVIEDGRIILTGANGLSRTIPVDRSNSFYIDWSLRWEDIHAEKTPVYRGQAPMELIHDFGRQNKVADWRPAFTNRIVIIGSVATGNNVADVGATPLEEKTPLVTKHLNVANSILEGRFVQRASPAATILWIVFMGAVAGFVTWSSPVVNASLRTGGIAIIFVLVAFIVYIQQRYWLPVVMPVFGGLLLPHFSLVTYRVLFEQREQRHIKSVFTKIVSPDVVNELLSAKTLSLGGELREITVYFADVRGFTEFTDQAKKAAQEYIEKHKLNPDEAKIFNDKQAAETLGTINLYLGTIADQIKKHNGTLDKYIGDCVMAFWGAPVPQEQHALCAVRAAIDSQRAMYAVNQQRAQENERRKAENEKRVANGEEPIALHPLLSLGSGINTGECTVGLMGSNDHIVNYTVFGVEVNLASRLEGVSGRGRIIISEQTYAQVKKVDPELAATFVEQAAVKVKGISNAVRNFEVPWKIAEGAPPGPSQTPAGGPEAAKA